MLPLIALAAPLIGGAMSLAGGAMSLTGGVMAAGSTMAGIAADAASGVIGAASRLTGGGKKSSTEEITEYEPEELGSDAQGKKALPPGVKLNKSGVMIQDSGGPGGGRILPGQFDEDGQLKSMDERLGSVTADRSDASPLQQILDHVKFIGANTARTAMGIGALLTQSVSSTVQDNIEGAKDKPDPKQGMVSRVFGGLTDRIKKISGSLGGVAKFMLKGLGLAGLIYLFKKNEESITKAVGGIFKFFHDLYKTMKESDDPLAAVMIFMKEELKKWGNGLVTMAQEFLDDTLKPMTESFISWLWENLKVFINEVLGIKLFDVEGDTTIRKTSKEMMSEGGVQERLSNYTVTDSSTKEKTSNLGMLTGITSFGNIRTFGYGKEGERTEINSLVLEKLKQLYAISEASGFRIQFPSLGFAFNDDSGFFDQIRRATLGTKSISISKIINAKPVLDDTELEMSNLESKSFSLLKSAGVTNESDDKNVTQIMKNLAKVAEYRMNISQGDLRRGRESGSGTLYQDLIDELLAENKTKYLANPKLIEQHNEGLKQVLPDKKLTDDANNAMMNKGSIFTHDTHLQKLIEPVSKAFENGGGSGTVIMDNSSNNNSVTKQGDNIQMPLDVHHSDPTARAFHEWKYA